MSSSFLPLNAKQDVRPGTRNPGTFDSTLINSSVIPSLKYSASGLPRRISYIHREGGGAAPKVLMTFDYGPYEKVGAATYPLSIQQSINGTPWMTVTVHSINLNVGLTDVDFPVAEEGN